jgi:hypothetical protein
VSACTCDDACLTYLPFRLQSNKLRPAIQADHQVGKYLDLGHINISGAGFRDMSWESYKALLAKWPRADWQGGAELVFVDSTI